MAENTFAAIQEFESKILDIISDNLEIITGQNIKLQVEAAEELDDAKLQEVLENKINAKIEFKEDQFGDWHYFMPEDLGGIFASTMIGEDPNPEFHEDQIEPLSELMSQMLSPYLSELSSIQSKPVETSVIDVTLLDDGSPEWSDDVHLVTISAVLNGDETFTMYKVVPGNLNNFLESAEDESPEETSGAEVDADDSEMFEVDTAQFQSLNDLASGDGGGANINMLMDIEMPITIELGRTKLSIKEILTLGQGSIIELDKLSGDPVDVFINEKRFARGEVVVVDENFGVRITEIVSPTEKIRSLQ